MSRLRHPVRSIREPFGTAGLIVAVVALVFAMLGGAYAASNPAGGGKATASAKAKQGKQGKPGKTGPAGPAGPAGAQGPAGANGKDGANGSNGANGAAGAAGASVTSTELAAGNSHCEEGGTEFKVGAGAPSYACNGEEGAPGPPGAPGAAGSPWVAGQAPSGVVMKGTWSIPPYTATAAGEPLYLPISTGVPIGGSVFALIGPETFTGCTGTAAAPTAEHVGVICIYPAESVNLEPEIGIEDSKLAASGGGSVVEFETHGAGNAHAYGSWALKTP